MKAIIIIAILALLVVAGCGPSTTQEKVSAPTVAKTDASVAEATSDIVDETDTVEIGEMI